MLNLLSSRVMQAILIYNVCSFRRYNGLVKKDKEKEFESGTGQLDPE